MFRESDPTSLNERSPQEWPSSSAADIIYVVGVSVLWLLGYNLMAAIYLLFLREGGF